MRLFRSFKPFLGLMFLVVMMSSCQEEELTTGKLKVTFTNRPIDLVVGIRPAESPQILISDWLTPAINGTLTYNLNYGNYILDCSSSSFPDVGFQIRAGETTTIFFDSDNVGHVQ